MTTAIPDMLSKATSMPTLSLYRRHVILGTWMALPAKWIFQRTV